MSYKCPDCGKINSAMYCEDCKKSLPRESKIFEGEPGYVPETAELPKQNLTERMRSYSPAQNSQNPDMLKSIERTVEKNNYVLNSISKKVNIMFVITILGLVCGALSAVLFCAGVIK